MKRGPAGRAAVSRAWQARRATGIVPLTMSKTSKSDTDGAARARDELRRALAPLARPPETRTPEWALGYRAGDYPPWAYTGDAVGLAADAEAGALRALLIERGQDPFAGCPAWPGGFVEQRTDRTGHDAAQRELREEVGPGTIRYLETLDTYDDNGRDPRQFAGEIDAASGRWTERGARIVSKAFLALLGEADITIAPEPGQDALRAHWASVYGYLPWEDLREEGGRRLARQLEAQLRVWASLGEGRVGAARAQRVRRAWGRSLALWNEELANERYALLLEAGLVEEAWRDRWGQLRPDVPRALLAPGGALAFDHRRMMADALSRVRSKMRYTPGVLAALAGRVVTLPALQRVVEAVGGRLLHTSNFRRAVVGSHGLLQPAGRHAERAGPGPRPALYAFPADVEYARLETSIRLPWTAPRG